MELRSNETNPFEAPVNVKETTYQHLQVFTENINQELKET